MDETRSRVSHLFRRAGFGARPDELDAAFSHGYEATVEALLAGLHGPDAAGDKIPTPTLPLYQPASAPVATDPAAKAAAARQRQTQQNVQYVALQTWWLNRMIATSTPLREKLTLLWHGHFATGFQKVRNAALMYQQNQLFRSLGAGNFETLTQAVAKDPAMMLWLDTQTNTAGHPNENFARELLELFTLGLGNYTEDDVKEAARCFTGWGFNRRTGGYVLSARRHDFGTKTFLGLTGRLSGEDVARIVTHHPASYRFVVAKLWSHLAYPIAPNDPLVTQLVVGYQRDLDITNLLRAIFLHPEFTGATARIGLVKQPIEYTVGIARAFGLDADLQPAGASSAGPAREGQGRVRPPTMPAVLRLLAQEPFNPSNVGGWPQNEYWLNTATSEFRLQFGMALARVLDLSWLNGLPAAQRADALARHLSIDGWGPTTTASLNHVVGDPPTLVALGLSAPEYVLN